MLVFSWNLNKNPTAFRFALGHLMQSGYSFLGCLQELPAEVGTTALARQATRSLAGDRVRCLGVTQAAPPFKHGRVGIFCSANLGGATTDVAHDARQRMAIVELTGAGADPLLVIGYHGVSRAEAPTEGQRALFGADARREIDKRWPRGALIMLGDFNANPSDPEVCGSSGLFALRDRAEADRPRASALVPLGEKLRPLYNPMWSLLPEGRDRPAGTHVHDGALTLRWRLYDQIVVSPDLVPALRGPPQIVTDVAGQRLVNANGNIDGSISDHLPVQVRVTT